MANSLKIGNKIKQARQALGLTQKQLAEKVDAEVLSARLLKLDEERARLDEERQAVERMQTRAVPIPTVAMFQSLGEELRRRMAEGPPAAAKALLRTCIRRIVANPSGRLEIELTMGKRTKSTGLVSEFAESDGWWTRHDHSANAGRPFRIVVNVA